MRIQLWWMPVPGVRRSWRVSMGMADRIWRWLNWDAARSTVREVLQARGDGKPDLAAANGSASVTVMTNIGK